MPAPALCDAGDHGTPQTWTHKISRIRNQGWVEAQPHSGCLSCLATSSATSVPPAPQGASAAASALVLRARVLRSPPHSACLHTPNPGQQCLGLSAQHRQPGLEVPWEDSGTFNPSNVRNLIMQNRTLFPWFLTCSSHSTSDPFFSFWCCFCF